MEEQDTGVMKISVTWRGIKYVVGIDAKASLKDLGVKLQKLTGVKADTMKLFASKRSTKSPKMLSPFSDDHSGLLLHEASISEGRSLRMMGVFVEEVDKVCQYENMDTGFDELDDAKKSLLLKIMGCERAHKLLQGPYIFHNFHPLEVGIEMIPPPGEALRLMRMLACDPGVVAAMNKRCWRVELISEMVPVGVIGVTPKCILGLNKNKGEEISLRLRIGNRHGFRAYDSIKKTLLHQLAHMVCSEHDADFYALYKELSEEVDALDWSKPVGKTFVGINRFEDLQEEYHDMLADDSRSIKQRGPDPTDEAINNLMDQIPRRRKFRDGGESDPDEDSCVLDKHKPDLDDSRTCPDGSRGNKVEPDPADFSPNNDLGVQAKPQSYQDLVSSQMVSSTLMKEPDPDDEELQRIRVAVNFACERLRRAIEMLKAEVNSAEMASVSQTLTRIIRNVIEHPDKIEYKRVRKTNRIFPRSFASSKATMEILQTIGFREDVVFDKNGKPETYLVLKRSDPGLLWLAKSLLEAYA